VALLPFIATTARRPAPGPHPSPSPGPDSAITRRPWC